MLQLYRYSWQPARYANPAWLAALGFRPRPTWRYGQQPQLDQGLNQALRQWRGIPPLGHALTPRARRLARLAPVMPQAALGLGLLALDCSDYLLLPGYREVIGQWLSEATLWQLFGLCSGKRGAVWAPEALVEQAMTLGTAVLTRMAVIEPVLSPLLLLLPPPARALWPTVPSTALILLEQVLCPPTH
ncbi:putative type III secretion apparatus [Sodalis glossinidius str. 'morsitans']|uniref:Type III secretion apparatus n=1 Tax=Sodalis glossinidius (strain morsitans) TaxID=343509 RepID=Q2NTF4_SODGM|nr:type III secretion system domain-containing protein [Sodalis glossinidius]BAE74571.1 putative type III secretion apparatus [Sodalis glossinidius str. 'morsitans']